VEIPDHISVAYHDIEQRSPEWFRLRLLAFVTASRFGDAAGLGYNSLWPHGQRQWVLRNFHPEFRDVPDDDKSDIMMLGNIMEPVVNLVYEKFMGPHLKDKVSEGNYYTINLRCLRGNWAEDGELTIGVSPDGVADLINSPDGLDRVGTEYKAPAFKIYEGKSYPVFGTMDIAPYYVCQMQGQCAALGVQAVDFVVFCSKTNEIRGYRVYFCLEFYQWMLDEIFVAYEMSRGPLSKYPHCGERCGCHAKKKPPFHLIRVVPLEELYPDRKFEVPSEEEIMAVMDI